MSPDEKKDAGFVLSDADAPRRPDDLPRIDFSTFVLSLAASGLMHLGLTPDPTRPEGERGEVSLPLARQSIDTLQMISEKTAGNLEDEEAKLLQSVLYELRMTYVRVERGESAE